MQMDNGMGGTYESSIAHLTLETGQVFQVIKPAVLDELGNVLTIADWDEAATHAAYNAWLANS